MHLTLVSGHSGANNTFSSLAPFQFSHFVMLCSALVKVPKIMDGIFLSLFGIELKGDIEDITTG